MDERLDIPWPHALGPRNQSYLTPPSPLAPLAAPPESLADPTTWAAGEGRNSALLR